MSPRAERTQMQIDIQHRDRQTGAPRTTETFHLPSFTVSPPGRPSDDTGELFNFGLNKVRFELSSYDGNRSSRMFEFARNLRELMGDASHLEMSVAVNVESQDGRPVMVFQAVN